MLQSEISFTYEGLKIIARYFWKRLEIVLLMSLLSSKNDWIWESNCTLKLARFRLSMLQSKISFTFEGLKMITRYAWKRLESVLVMSLLSSKNDLIWESICTFKLAGFRPNMLQSAIIFTYEGLKMLLRYAWKRFKIVLSMSLFSLKSDLIWESICTFKLAGFRPNMLQSEISFTYEGFKIISRYASKRLTVALPLSLLSLKGDLKWERNCTLKLAWFRSSMLQSVITFTYGGLKTILRYYWKRLMISVSMSLFSFKNDLIWESICTFKLCGFRPSMRQSEITFTYQGIKMIARYYWKRFEIALLISLLSLKDDLIWKSNCTLKLAGFRPSILQSAITFSYGGLQIILRYAWKCLKIALWMSLLCTKGD